MALTKPGLIVAIFIAFLAMCVGISSAEMEMLDISSKMNAPFTPNPMGGDQTDYSWVVEGTHIYDNIPFSIGNVLCPFGNKIVVSNGGNVPSEPAYSYASVFEFQVPTELQQQVNNVYILGLAAGWGCPPYGSFGDNGGSLTFLYSDGSSFSQPLRQGIEFDDWGCPHIASNAIFADSGICTRGIVTHIDILTVDIPSTYLNKNLTNIRFEDSGSIAAIPIFAITLETNQQPDLIIEDIQAPIRGFIGDTMWANVTVKNTGTVPAENFYVNLYLSPDEDIAEDGTGEIPLGSKMISLADGESKDVEIEFTLEENKRQKIDSNFYFLGAYADPTATSIPSGRVTEINEDNNYASTVFPVGHKYAVLVGINTYPKEAKITETRGANAVKELDPILTKLNFKVIPLVEQKATASRLNTELNI